MKKSRITDSLHLDMNTKYSRRARFCIHISRGCWQNSHIYDDYSFCRTLWL